MSGAYKAKGAWDQLIRIRVDIPLPLSPGERCELFEDPLFDLLEEYDPRHRKYDFHGSGTYGNSDGLSGFDLDLSVTDSAIIPSILRLLIQCGAPTTSGVKIDGLKLDSDFCGALKRLSPR